MAAHLHRRRTPAEPRAERRARGLSPASAYALVVAAAAIPRLVVLAHERGDILASYVEKSDDIARTFVASGTFGYVPGEPSAYTQPLYAFFLVPLYWLFGRGWATVGLAQVAVAAATAVVVFEIGRRLLGRRAGLLAALITTLHPYLIWHDVHVNREILDQLLGALIVLLTLVAVERRSLPWAALLGVVLGLAILGNSRLAALPLVIAAFLLWRTGRGRTGLALAGVALALTAVTVAPWVVRNRVSVGCFAITTDSRALWKANNEHTYATLAGGGWIDDVPDPPNAGITPQAAGDVYRSSGRVVAIDECALMRSYQDRVLTFWREHPGEKARLAGQATVMLWDPRVGMSEGRSGKGTSLDSLRSVAEPAYMSVVFALAAAGLALAPRAFAVLAASLLAYETLAAWIFAGTTRYRVPWDFLLALLAAAAVSWAAARRRAR